MTKNSIYCTRVVKESGVAGSRFKFSNVSDAGNDTFEIIEKRNYSKLLFGTEFEISSVRKSQIFEIALGFDW